MKLCTQRGKGQGRTCSGRGRDDFCRIALNGDRNRVGIIGKTVDLCGDGGRAFCHSVEITAVYPHHSGVAGGPGDTLALKRGAVEGVVQLIPVPYLQILVLQPRLVQNDPLHRHGTGSLLGRRCRKDLGLSRGNTGDRAGLIHVSHSLVPAAPGHGLWGSGRQDRGCELPGIPRRQLQGSRRHGHTGGISRADRDGTGIFLCLPASTGWCYSDGDRHRLVLCGFRHRQGLHCRGEGIGRGRGHGHLILPAVGHLPVNSGPLRQDCAAVGEGHSCRQYLRLSHL